MNKDIGLTYTCLCILVIACAGCNGSSSDRVDPPDIKTIQSLVLDSNIQIKPIIFENLSGSVLTHCISEDLPLGLSVDVSGDGTGCVLTGTPLTPQNLQLHSVIAKSSSGNDKVNFSVSINAPPLGISFGEPKLFKFSWGEVEGIHQYRLYENVDGQSGFELLSSFSSDIHQYDYQIPLYGRANAQYLMEYCLSDNDADCYLSQTVSVVNNLSESIGVIRGSTVDEGEFFGTAIAMSDDGNTLAVGAQYDAGELNDSLEAGAVYIFVKNEYTWVEQAVIRSENIDAGDLFGYSLDLSSDGNTLVVGAPREDGSGIGINPVDNNDLDSSGAVYVFYRTDQQWAQTDYIKSDQIAAYDNFGISVSLSNDAMTLAVSAPFYENNLANLDSGAVYIFKYISPFAGPVEWQQTATIIRSFQDNSSDRFGTVLQLNGDGKTLAVGTYLEDSNASGIDGDETNNNAVDSGAVYVFYESDLGWVRQAYLKADTPNSEDYFGWSLTLSDSGDTLAVGALREDSSAGSVYVFDRNNDQWNQSARVVSDNADAMDNFGRSLAMSADGSKLAVGANHERGASVGLNGSRDHGTLHSLGAVYILDRSGSTWIETAYVKSNEVTEGQEFGGFIDLSSDGNTLAVGSFHLNKVLLY